MTNIHIAASNGKLDIVKHYLRSEKDINIVDSDGLTILHNAAFRGWVDLVKLLCENGADIELGNLSLIHISEPTRPY